MQLTSSLVGKYEREPIAFPLQQFVRHLIQFYLRATVVLTNVADHDCINNELAPLMLVDRNPQNTRPFLIVLWLDFLLILRFQFVPPEYL